MNSKQRRKDRREYRYRVRSNWDHWDDYVERFRWCQKTFGIRVMDGWRSTKISAHDVWEFDSEKKAALFALRWAK